jgi:predicted phage-related endonuclease
MTITYHTDLIQGSDEWLAARMGILTASEVKHILTPTLKIANNDKTRQHVWELAAQRITGYTEPQYIGDDMLRGYADEILAREKYSETRAEVQEVGFITSDALGFVMGYSPDGLVGDDGLIECKSRRQKYQVQTICEGAVPDEYVLQLQTGLLITGRKWVDFISYSGGLPMFVQRVLPDLVMQAAIVSAATDFEAKVAQAVQSFHDNVAAHGYPATERVVEQEMYMGETT